MPDMARRRYQKTGHVYKEGGWWYCRFREDVRDANGIIKRTRRKAIIGPETMSKKQALREAWDKVLSKVDQFNAVPQSVMSLQQFVTQKFEPEVIWTLKHAGKEHYKYCLSRILPKLGSASLRTINMERIQTFCRAMVEVEKLSTQTVHHLRNALSAIFKHAKAIGYYAGENPASLVRLPEIESKPINALSFEQAKAALDLLSSPVREMAFLSMTMSPNVAELCGLRWKLVNLAAAPIVSAGELLPPYSIAIRENWYRGKPGTVKTGKRNRFVPLPAAAVEMLELLSKRSEFTGPDDYVFASSSGKPVDAHNVNNREFAALRGCPEDDPDPRRLLLRKVRITWHVFRHSCATFAEQVEMMRSDRIALMGHGAGSMTDRYTHHDVERLRASVEKIADRLITARPKLAEMKPGGGVM